MYYKKLPKVSKYRRWPILHKKSIKTEASSLEYPKHYIIDVGSKGKEIKVMLNGLMLKSIQICEPLVTPEGLATCEWLLTDTSVRPTDPISFNKTASDSGIQVWSWSEIKFWLQPVC